MIRKVLFLISEVQVFCSKNIKSTIFNRNKDVSFEMGFKIF